MSRARVGLRVGGSVATLGCFFALACGSRTGIEPCVWAACSDAGGGSRATTSGGRSASGGSRPHSGGASGVSGGSGGAVSVGGVAGGLSTGGVAAAGEPAVAGAAGATSETPVVLLLLDGSTSMYDSQVWSPTYEAVTGPGGPLDRYQDRVRFGFVSYRGAGQTLEEDPACAELTTVDFALFNTPRIREAYGVLGGLRRWPPWETPTGHALARVTPSLLAAAPEAAKYILLISDGAPDTCQTTNPQCGQDRAVWAVQQAFRSGIETRAIGIGFGNEYPGCTPDTARCASDHFQDIANAGRGLRVQAPPVAYSSLPCIAETDGQLLSDYSVEGDFAPYKWTKSPTEVADAVTAVLQEVVRR